MGGRARGSDHNWSMRKDARESWDVTSTWTQDKIISSPRAEIQAPSTGEDPDSIFPLLLIKQVQTDIDLLQLQRSRLQRQRLRAGGWLLVEEGIKLANEEMDGGGGMGGGGRSRV